MSEKKEPTLKEIVDAHTAFVGIFVDWYRWVWDRRVKAFSEYGKRRKKGE